MVPPQVKRKRDVEKEKEKEMQSNDGTQEKEAKRIKLPPKPIQAKVPVKSGGVLGSAFRQEQQHQQQSTPPIEQKKKLFKGDEGERGSEVQKDDRMEGMEENNEKSKKYQQKVSMAMRYRYGNYDGYYTYRITDDFEVDPRLGFIISFFIIDLIIFLKKKIKNV
mgnify:CR=1 FL=1